MMTRIVVVSMRVSYACDRYVEFQTAPFKACENRRAHGCREQALARITLRRATWSRKDKTTLCKGDDDEARRVELLILACAKSSCRCRWRSRFAPDFETLPRI